MNFFKATRKETINWTQSIVNPLNQQLRIHHHMIIAHQQELETLKKSEFNIEGKLKALNSLMTDLEMERDTALELSHRLEDKKLFDPEPIKKSNIVPLSAATRGK